MSILHRILRDTRRFVRQRKQTVTPAHLVHLAREQPPTKSLARALGGTHLSIIAEFKRASPSKGALRMHANAGTIANDYEAAGADAVSVLTEPLHFQGSLNDLVDACGCTGLPLLRKDFIVDPYQVLEARAHGADAILLIAAALESGQMRELQQAAAEVGLDCLMEVYEANELDRLDLDHVRILGVNNRDLRTFEVDIHHSLRVFAQVPPTILRVSESGLRSAEDLARLHCGGVDAVLIGEAFMAARNPGSALRGLRRQLASILAA